MQPTTQIPSPDPSVDYASQPLHLYDALIAQSSRHQHYRKALSTLDSAFRLYGATNLAVAFNGGKDATVILYLTLAALANYDRVTTLASAQSTSTTATASRLSCLYLQGTDKKANFSEVDQFLNDIISPSSSLSSRMDCTFVPAGIRDGIEQFVHTRQGLCAFVMGTRRADPHGATMEHFEPSSPTWPAFMRVNPIIQWTYSDVWHFLRSFSIPFCTLYQRGYTSLGSVATTLPNPALRYEAPDGSIAFKPAWLLEDESMERAGRLKREDS